MPVFFPRASVLSLLLVVMMASPRQAQAADDEPWSFDFGVRGELFGSVNAVVETTRLNRISAPYDRSRASPGLGGELGIERRLAPHFALGVRAATVVWEPSARDGELIRTDLSLAPTWVMSWGSWQISSGLLFGPTHQVPYEPKLGTDQTGIGLHVGARLSVERQLTGPVSLFTAVDMRYAWSRHGIGVGEEGPRGADRAFGDPVSLRLGVARMGLTVGARIRW